MIMDKVSEYNEIASKEYQAGVDEWHSRQVCERLAECSCLSWEMNDFSPPIHSFNFIVTFHLKTHLGIVVFLLSDVVSGAEEPSDRNVHSSTKRMAASRERCDETDWKVSAPRTGLHDVTQRAHNEKTDPTLLFFHIHLFFENEIDLRMSSFHCHNAADSSQVYWVFYISICLMFSLT